MNIKYFYHHNLIKLYVSILKDLNIQVIKQNNLEYLFSKNLKNSYNLIFDNNQMVLVDDHYFSTLRKENKPKMIFNPIDEEGSLCSHLALEDAIHSRLSIFIYKIFKIIIEEKLNINNEKDNCYTLDTELISSLPLIDINTFCKWKNIFNIINSTSFCRNIISFSFEYNEYSQSSHVKFDYLLYKYLVEMKDNIIFGITLKDSEIKLLKEIYKKFIIDIFENKFKSDINITKNSDKSPTFYTLIKFYLSIKELFEKEYNIRSDTRSFKYIENEISDLNKYIYLRKNDDFMKKYKEIQNANNKAYSNELKIRKECEPNWFLLKDNNMIKEKKNSLLTQDEINKKWNNQYFNTYIQKTSSFYASRDVERCIADIQHMKNNHAYSEILQLQELVLKIINGEGGRLWFDTRTKKYSFRSEYAGKIVNNDKKDITVVLNKAMQKNLPKYHNYDTNSFNHMIEVVLIESISDIPKQILKDEYKADKVVKVLLFTSAIPSIDGDVFDTTRNEEIFQSETDLLFKRNRFIPTKYLSKGYVSYNIERQDHQEKSFIQNFIFQMVGGDKEKATYILNWLAYSYQELKPTGSALVFLGEQEVSNDLFFKRIIIEIFGKPYCSNIDDNSGYKTALIQDVAKDKLFLNVGTIYDAGTQFDDTALALLIKELLIQSKISFTNDNNEQEKLEIHSQVLITATNPAPYLKKALSKCSVFNITDIDTIMANLELEDEIELEDKILKDLDSFSDLLKCYKVDEQVAINKLFTVERELLKDKKTETNINKEDRDSKIDDFIQAIIDKDIDYFVTVKGNIDKQGKDIYAQLKNTFNKEEGYFVTNDLYLYFNAVYPDLTFKNNSTLLDLLKEKNSMFNQQYLKLTILDEDGNKDILFEKYSSVDLNIGSKNLLKINGYKLPEEFTIKAGWFAETNDNSFKKYTYENKETSKKAFEDYKLKNKG